MNPHFNILFELLHSQPVSFNILRHRPVYVTHRIIENLPFIESRPDKCLCNKIFFFKCSYVNLQFVIELLSVVIICQHNRNIAYCHYKYLCNYQLDRHLEGCHHSTLMISIAANIHNEYSLSLIYFPSFIQEYIPVPFLSQ